MLKGIQANPEIYRLFFHLSLDIDFSVKYNLVKGIRFTENTNQYDFMFTQARLRAVLASRIENNCQTNPEEINQLIIQKLEDLEFYFNKN